VNSVYETDRILNNGLGNRLNRILKLPEVICRTGYSRSSIYQKISEGIFPKPIHLGVRAVGWLEYEIVEWINTRIKFSRNFNPENNTHSSHNKKL